MNTEVALGRPIQGAISIIDEYPLDVVQKTGKYKLLYDYNAGLAFIFNGILSNVNHLQNEKKEYSDVQVEEETLYNTPKPTASVNPNSQVGVFSKGDVVNVIKFNGNLAVVQNPNYVEGKNSTGYLSLLNTNSKEFNILKEYLSKVDDSTPITINTGVNFGANIKPKPLPDVKNPINEVADQPIEENAEFILKEDFKYRKNDNTNQNVIPDFKTLPLGTKVVGDIYRPKMSDNPKVKFQNAGLPVNYFDYLEIKGFTDSNSLKIPILKLTKNAPTNNNSLIPVENNNKNLLIIAGALLVGYALFNKGKSE